MQYLLFRLLRLDSCWEMSSLEKTVIGFDYKLLGPIGGQPNNSFLYLSFHYTS